MAGCLGTDSVLSQLGKSSQLEPPGSGEGNLPAEGAPDPRPPTAGTPLPPPNAPICQEDPAAPVCDRTPVVSTPGVVTVMFTLSQIPQAAGTLILANAIRYASPERQPRILFLKDSRTNGEDEGDPAHIQQQLLRGYDLEYRALIDGGLSPEALRDREGRPAFDLVIVSNPGHPLSDRATLDTLVAFRGGVILVGDDLAQGRGFSTEALTGLRYRANGDSIACDGRSYRFDNLAGYRYRVAFDPELLPGMPPDVQSFEYGNDLDHTTAREGVQVLAWARAAEGTCDIGRIPAVVRRPR